MKIEEHQIPALIKAGKGNEVIAAIYKLIFPKVRNYIIMNSGRKEDASDVFQDAILYFYKQVLENKFNEKYTVYGYLYRLSINRWINKLKKDKRISFQGEWMEKHEGSDEIDFSELEHLYTHQGSIHTILEGVGEKCKEILTYAILYDLMLEDIMTRMEFPSEGAVKMQLKRCKDKLYKMITENSSLVKMLKKE